MCFGLDKMTSDPKSFEHSDTKSKPTTKRIYDFVEYNKNPHELATIAYQRRPSAEQYKYKPGHDIRTAPKNHRDSFDTNKDKTLLSETSGLLKSKHSEESTMKGGDGSKNVENTETTETSEKGKRSQKSRNRGSKYSKYGQFPEPVYQPAIILKRSDKDASTLTVENSLRSEVDEDKLKKEASTQVIEEPTISKLYTSERRPGSIKHLSNLIDQRYSLKNPSQNAFKSSSNELKRPSKSGVSNPNLLEPASPTKFVKSLSNELKDNAKVLTSQSDESSKSSKNSSTSKRRKHRVTDSKFLQPIYFIILPTKVNKSKTNCKPLAKMYSKNFLIPTILPHLNRASKKKSNNCNPIVVCKDSSSSLISTSSNCECSDKSDSLYNVSDTCLV